MTIMQWGQQDYEPDGKLVVLYRFKRILDEGVVIPGDRVLDVGGWGKLEYRLTQEGCFVDLINIDPDECRRVKDLYGTSFIVMNEDIRTYGLPEDKYDVVTCFETLEHICEGRDVAIEKIFKTLRPGGRFVGTIPIPGRCHPVGDPTVVFILPDELKDILSKYATDIKIEPTGSISPDELPCSWYFVATKRKEIK